MVRLASIQKLQLKHEKYEIRDMTWNQRRASQSRLSTEEVIKLSSRWERKWSSSSWSRMFLKPNVAASSTHTPESMWVCGLCFKKSPARAKGNHHQVSSGCQLPIKSRSLNIGSSIKRQQKNRKGTALFWNYYANNMWWIVGPNWRNRIISWWKYMTSNTRNFLRQVNYNNENKRRFQFWSNSQEYQKPRIISASSSNSPLLILTRPFGDTHTPLVKRERSTWKCPHGAGSWKT